MSEFGYTVAPADATGDLVHALAEAGAPKKKLPPGKWVKKNLFSNWYNTLLTVVFGTLSLYLLYRLAIFVFVTGRWEPIDVNLELFMIGQFPRDERWRIVAQLIIFAGAVGLALGSQRMAAQDRADDNDVPFERESPRTYVASYWAVGLFLAVLLFGFCRTIGPYIVAVGCVVAAIAGYLITRSFPKRLRLLSWTLAALGLVVQLQLLTGTFGLAWLFTTLAIAPFVSDEVARLLRRLDPRIGVALAAVGAGIGLVVLVIRFVDVVGILALAIGLYAFVTALRGDRVDGGRVGGVMVAGVIVFFVYQSIGLEGIDWREWGGFHLNIIATAVAILLAFPLGVVLAMGRRSQLPAIKVMSVAYIEFFRGAPLITFLLAAQFFLGFFLDSDTPLSLITRAIAAVTLFTAAYIAEIVRGGLQSVPRGQIEAGQAVGLSQPRILRMIVLPQALRAVIPAMVGQFISLFKDTTLFVIITIPEYLAVREIVHSQEAFRGFGIGETLVFVAFGFWAVSFTMSRESQRLERRLGVGER